MADSTASVVSSFNSTLTINRLTEEQYQSLPPSYFEQDYHNFELFVTEGDSGSGMSHIRLTQEEYNAMSVAGTLQSGTLYLTEGNAGGLGGDISAATVSSLGGIMLGFSRGTAQNKYPIELNEENRAFVSVDAVNEIKAGDNVTVSRSGNQVTVNCYPEVSFTGGTVNVPIGTIIPFCGANTPEGFLFCDGSLCSRTELSDLFAVIGTTFGEGDGSTTFALPKLDDGRFIEGGNENGNYLSAGLPKPTVDKGTLGIQDGGTHSHSIVCYNLGDVGASNQPTTNHEHVNSYTAKTNTDGSHTHTLSGNVEISADGIYGNSETVQPNALTMRYFIKARYSNSDMVEGQTKIFKMNGSDVLLGQNTSLTSEEWTFTLTDGSSYTRKVAFFS